MELSRYQKDDVVPDVQLNSRVVSVVVSNPSTENLKHPVIITFSHLEVFVPLSPPLVLYKLINLTPASFA